jgi:hypothetical protein
MCLDIKNFYLTAPLDQFEYMKMPIDLFPEWIVKQYELMKHVLNGFIYLEMRCAVWGLPQAGILANKLLRKHLLPHGYYKCNNTPGLWKHETRPILITLVVNNFGVKYVGKEHVDHLIRCIKEQYELTEDWTGDLYCGIKLKWDYEARMVNLSIPATSNNSSSNASIACQLNLNIACTPLPPNSMEPKPRHLSLLIFLPNYHPKK